MLLLSLINNIVMALGAYIYYIRSISVVSKPAFQGLTSVTNWTSLLPICTEVCQGNLSLLGSQVWREQHNIHYKPATTINIIAA